MSLKPFPPVSFLSEQRVSRVRFSLTKACVFASLMNWERFSRIKILPISIHNIDNQGNRHFVLPWRRFCNLFIEGLSDRGAADAVRGRIDWKYLLCLELDDPGFDHTALCEFRGRLLEGGAERILFDKIL